MKLAPLLLAYVTHTASVSAFGVTRQPAVPTRCTASFNRPALVSTRNGPVAPQSVPFRDPSVTRGRMAKEKEEVFYDVALKVAPRTTKAFTSLVGWALCDLLAQIFISRGSFDMKRFVSLCVFGFIGHGPAGHYFYDWLDSKINGNDVADVALKVAIDQIIFLPIFMSVFFAYLGVVNGDSISGIISKVKKDLLSACQVSWKISSLGALFWPLTQAVNFKYLKTKHRVVFTNSIQIAYNLFFSVLSTSGTNHSMSRAPMQSLVPKL